MEKLTFTENQIQRLFGHEAAENETPERLREYYFKNDTYDQVTADLSLRLLVGHKGVGKSALFKVAQAEALENGRLAIWVRPDDIIGIGADTSDFLKAVRDWKEGLLSIVCSKILSSFGEESTDTIQRVKRFSAQALELVAGYLADKGVNTEDAKLLALKGFISSKKVIVFVDDLDRGWQGQRSDVIRISALLNAVRDLASDVQGLYFKVSLRSDVYYLARTSDESTDKIEGSVIWHSWTNHEIFVLLVKRIRTFFELTVDEAALLATPQPLLANHLTQVLEDRFSGEGKWKNAPMYRVLMSLIRKRPRDLVKLLTLAAREARSRGASQIGTVDFKAIFEEYSQGRIQDTINEFRSELPDIERLLSNMKPNKRERQARAGYLYKTGDLLAKIDNICQMGGFTIASGQRATTKELAAFMYKINFLIARKDSVNGEIVRRYFEENRYLSSSFADFGFDWEVHPAYRWALQPDTVHDIFANVQLSD